VGQVFASLCGSDRAILSHKTGPSRALRANPVRIIFLMGGGGATRISASTFCVAVPPPPPRAAPRQPSARRRWTRAPRARCGAARARRRRSSARRGTGTRRWSSCCSPAAPTPTAASPAVRVRSRSPPLAVPPSPPPSIPSPPPRLTHTHRHTHARILTSRIPWSEAACTARCRQRGLRAGTAELRALSAERARSRAPGGERRAGGRDRHCYRRGPAGCGANASGAGGYLMQAVSCAVLRVGGAGHGRRQLAQKRLAFASSLGGRLGRGSLLGDPHPRNAALR
jgi:hypothetical protein